MERKEESGEGAGENEGIKGRICAKKHESSTSRCEFCMRHNLG